VVTVELAEAEADLVPEEAVEAEAEAVLEVVNLE
jgi:hypothetical protein